MADLGRHLVYLLAAQCTLIQPALARTKPSPFLTLGGRAETPKGYLAMCAQTPLACDDNASAVMLAGTDAAALAAGEPIGATAAIVAPSRALSSHTLPSHPLRSTSLAPSVATMLRERRPGFLVTVHDTTLDRRFGGFVVVPKTRVPLQSLQSFRYTIDSAAVSASAHTSVERAKPSPLASPEDEQQILQRINVRVNRIVRQATDLSIYGRDEVWQRSGAYEGAAGDCEDIALEKQAELVAAGFPRSRLSLAVVYAPIVGLHTILVARTRDGDQVLDSRSPYLRPWWKSGYSWLSVQSFAGSRFWRRPLSEQQVAAAGARAAEAPEARQS